MHTEKTFEQYIDEVHAVATVLTADLNDVEPFIQMGALTKVVSNLIYASIQAGVFHSLDDAVEHYASGLRAMHADLERHHERVKQ